jgi:hypothetical protein
VLEVVHENDALAVLFQLGHHRFDHLFRPIQFEVEGIDAGRENSDVTLAEIGQKLRRMLQIGEAEERRDRRCGC